MPQHDHDDDIALLWDTGDYTMQQIANKFNLTRGQIGRSLIRTGAFNETPKPSRKKAGKQDHNHKWSDQRLTERWSTYAARRRRERQEQA